MMRKGSSNQDSQNSLKFVKNGSMSNLNKQISVRSNGVTATPQFNEYDSQRDSPNYHAKQLVIQEKLNEQNIEQKEEIPIVAMHDGTQIKATTVVTDENIDTNVFKAEIDTDDGDDFAQYTDNLIRSQKDLNNLQENPSQLKTYKITGNPQKP